MAHGIQPGMSVEEQYCSGNEDKHCQYEIVADSAHIAVIFLGCGLSLEVCALTKLYPQSLPTH